MSRLEIVPPGGSPAPREHTFLATGRVQFGLGALVLPALLAVGGWLAWRDAQPYLSWRATPAMVLESGVEPSTPTRARRAWRANVHYGWMISGRWRDWDRVNRDQRWYRSSAEAWRVVHRYDGGQPVTAWVNPADPDEAVLDRRPSAFPYLFLLAVGVLAALFAFLAGRKGRPWRAGGTGWSVEVRTTGAAPMPPAAEPAPDDAVALRDGTTGEPVEIDRIQNRPID